MTNDARIEAAAGAIIETLRTSSRVEDWLTSALAAADEVMFSDEAVERAADVLLQEQTNGACRLGKVCDLCDCFARYDATVIKDRDNYARAHVRAVIAALKGGA